METTSLVAEFVTLLYDPDRPRTRRPIADLPERLKNKSLWELCAAEGYVQFWRTDQDGTFSPIWTQSLIPHLDPATTSVLLLDQGAKLAARLALATNATNINGSKPARNAEVDLERIALAVGDETAAKVLGIAQRSDWDPDRKLSEIGRLDTRYKGKTSDELGTLLGVSGPRIRQLPTWKEWREADKESD